MESLGRRRSKIQTDFWKKEMFSDNEVFKMYLKPFKWLHNYAKNQKAQNIYTQRMKFWMWLVSNWKSLTKFVQIESTLSQQEPLETCACQSKLCQLAEQSPQNCVHNEKICKKCSKRSLNTQILFFFCLSFSAPTPPSRFHREKVWQVYLIGIFEQNSHKIKHEITFFLLEAKFTFQIQM